MGERKTEREVEDEGERKKESDTEKEGRKRDVESEGGRERERDEGTGGERGKEREKDKSAAKRRRLPPRLSLSAGFTWMGRVIWERERERRGG